MSRLSVWLGGEHVGWLSHDAQTNRFAFEYTPAWVSGARAFPISPSLPLTPPVAMTPDAHSADVRIFFDNLLPEGHALDDAARAAGTSKTNLVALMLSLGGEVAGALRVLSEDAATNPAAAAGEDRLREVSKEELSARIRERAHMPFSVWDRKVRLSIAGYQDKIAVCERDARWFLVDGPRMASTVIIKPAPTDPRLASVPYNEYMCMQLARYCGLAVATTRLAHVPEPLLLVDRFDRVNEGDRVRRIHVIDGCQALGRAVTFKYERNLGSGHDVRHIRDGVSLPKLFGVLEQSRQPAVDRQALLKWVIFQLLVGNTDAHGKNVTFFSDAQGLQFAPMYDVVCIPAIGASDIEEEYAMAIGDAFSDREISPYEWANFAESCRVPLRNVARQLQQLATEVVEQLPIVVSDVAQAGVPPAVATAVGKVVSENCRRHLAIVNVIGKAKSLVSTPAAKATLRPARPRAARRGY